MLSANINIVLTIRWTLFSMLAIFNLCNPSKSLSGHYDHFHLIPKETKTEVTEVGAPEWLSWSSVQLLISAQVTIPGSWDQALHQALYWAWSLLKILSLKKNNNNKAQKSRMITLLATRVKVWTQTIWCTSLCASSVHYTASQFKFECFCIYQLSGLYHPKTSNYLIFSVQSTFTCIPPCDLCIRFEK